MRLPNGYGTVYKLSGKRRNPWIARKHKGWNRDDEKQKATPIYETIGYYPTKASALQALAEYNISPFPTFNKTTFEEIYDLWSEKTFDSFSRSSKASYVSAYKSCAEIYDIPFNQLKLSHLQHIIDTCGKNPPSLKKIKILFSQLFDYAVKNEIIGKDKHIVEYIEIPKYETSSLHYRFNNDELKAIWEHASNEWVQVLLMLIYTGVRPGELFGLRKTNINLAEQWFYIEKGKNDNAERKVPIADKILPFFTNWMNLRETEYLVTQLNGRKINFDTAHKQFTETYWVPLLQELGILNYINDKGEQREHLPDDTRHTFTTIWKEKKLDEAMRRKIQGHSGKGIGEIVYTHFDMERLREEINKL